MTGFELSRFFGAGWGLIERIRTHVGRQQLWTGDVGLAARLMETEKTLALRPTFAITKALQPHDADGGE
jgi:hypothetical protein